MVRIEEFQAAIVSFLKQNLTGTVPVENIAEYTFQTDEFSQPAVRIRLRPETPIGNGTDRLKLSNYTFTIQVYSERDSSREASSIMSIINQLIHNNQILGINLDINRIGITNVTPPLRISRRLWMAETFYTAFVSTKISAINT